MYLHVKQGSYGTLKICFLSEKWQDNIFFGCKQNFEKRTLCTIELCSDALTWKRTHSRQESLCLPCEQFRDVSL